MEIENCAHCGKPVDVTEDTFRVPGRNVFCKNTLCGRRFWANRNYKRKGTKPGPKSTTGPTKEYYNTQPPKDCTLNIESCLDCPLNKCSLEK